MKNIYGCFYNKRKQKIGKTCVKELLIINQFSKDIFFNFFIFFVVNYFV